MNLAENIKNLKVGKNSLAIYWLGNASFIVKTSSHTTVAIDLYLSDLAEKVYGYSFRRIMPPLVDAKDLHLDLFVATHHHEDHLDLDLLTKLMANKEVKLLSTPASIEACIARNIDREKLYAIKPGELFTANDLKLHALYADHGDLAPDAIGFILECDSIRIYIVGDSAYRPYEMAKAFAMRPDVIIPPINGRFGNLGPEEAAYVVRDSGAKVAIPSHFWMFPGHGGDPGAFYEAVQKYAPGAETIFLTGGSCYIYKNKLY